MEHGEHGSDKRGGDELAPEVDAEQDPPTQADAKTSLLENPDSGTHEPPYRRQALVVIHGMGEQRPVETLNAFSTMVTNGGRVHSRPAKIDGAYEARMHVVPRSDLNDAGVRVPFDAQTDIYEYHWAHLMQGNRLDDLWPTVRRMMFPVTGVVMTMFALILVAVLTLGVVWQTQILPPPSFIAPIVPVTLIVVAVVGLLVVLLPNVPPALIGLWVIVWAAVGVLIWAFMTIPAVQNLETFASPAALVAALLAGSASSIAVVAYLASRFLPGWLVKSFVDVVRYLDTSPRSYDARREIRKGIVDLLDGLQRSGKYSRIIVAAHSLGSYIGYDAISYLWTVRNERFTLTQEDVEELEQAATALQKGWAGRGRFDFRDRWAQLKEERRVYREQQRKLWLKLRKGGHPWIITDFISFGSPMNFADRLFTRNWKVFEDRITRREVVTCPPVSEDAEPRSETPEKDRVWLTWPDKTGTKRRLHEAAPFAVVRWTNLWYPARIGFFGDWFGGPLARLFGPAVEDIRLDKASAASRIPGYAHSVYLREGSRSGNRRKDGSFGKRFDEALDLSSASWLPKAPWPPLPPRTQAKLHMSGAAHLAPSEDGNMNLEFDGALELAERRAKRFRAGAGNGNGNGKAKANAEAEVVQPG